MLCALSVTCCVVCFYFILLVAVNHAEAWRGGGILLVAIAQVAARSDDRCVVKLYVNKSRRFTKYRSFRGL